MRTLRPTIQVQGSTASPSTVGVQVVDSSIQNFVLLRVRVCDNGTLANATNATIAATNGTTVAETHTGTKDLTLKSPVNTAATGTLTISGVVIDGETATIGGVIFEFNTNTSRTVTAGRVNVPIDHSAASSNISAQGTLTIAATPTAGDHIKLGNRQYLYVANGTAASPGEISIGTSASTAQANTLAAINGTDGFNTPNTQVTASAFVTNVSTLTAKQGGIAGNSVPSTSSFTSGSNLFNGTTLGTTTAGVDTSASQAATALRAAINANTTRCPVNATGSSGTVTLTAISQSVAGNNITTAETMANGSFGGSTLAGGVNGNSGFISFTVTDASAETVTIRFGRSVVSPVEGDYTATQQLTHA